MLAADCGDVGIVSAEGSSISNFWDFMWLIASAFLFVAYLLILFRIIGDLFRDSELGGGAKALWLICLLFLPMLTALVYVIARGKGMAARQQASLQKAKADGTPGAREAAIRAAG